jgi:hypothetical protein
MLVSGFGLHGGREPVEGSLERNGLGGMAESSQTRL